MSIATQSTNAPWLDTRVPVGTNLHRAGWPWVMQELAPATMKQRALTGAIIDDFLEQSFLWGGGPELVYAKPFVAIAHNPAYIDSPLASDKRDVCTNVNRCARWRKSKRGCRGIITLSDDLAAHVKRQFRVPVLSLRHPMEIRDDVQWNPDTLFNKPVSVVSLGYFLRDTRILYRVPCVDGFVFARCCNHLNWQQRRDAKLYELLSRSEQHSHVITSDARLSNDDYDNVRRNCIVVSWLYAASANNVICECIASNTPIICNPLPSVLEYLGRRYPLYAETPDEIATILRDKKRILAGHNYLLAVDKSFLDRTTFVTECMRFAEKLC